MFHLDVPMEITMDLKAVVYLIINRALIQQVA